MKTIIDHNPHIALSDLKELFRLSEGSASFTANGVQYTIVFSLEKQICVFLWEYNGKKKQEKIELRKEPTGLCVVFCLSMHKAQMSKTIFRREYYSKPVRI